MTRFDNTRKNVTDSMTVGRTDRHHMTAQAALTHSIMHPATKVVSDPQQIAAASHCQGSHGSAECKQLQD